MEMIGLRTPVHHVGVGGGVPDISYAEWSIEIKSEHALKVHVDGLIDEIHGIRRLVRKLHRGLVAILEIEGRYIFLPEDIVELGIILNIGLQLEITDNCRVVVNVARAAM